MPGHVRLRVVEGPQRGNARLFDQHERVLIGRDRSCNPTFTGDRALAARHFLVEIVPPRARLLDLGTEPGTYVNNAFVGARRSEGTGPEPVELRNGDRIRAGSSVFEVVILEPDPCVLCGEPVEDTDEPLCVKCRPATARDEDDPPPGGLESIARAFGSGVSPTELRSAEEYDVLEELGTGGFGSVYLVEEIATGRRSALKLMRPQTAGSLEMQRRFVREASVALSLDHPNIVALYDRGSSGPVLFFSMEYCNGGDLRTYARDRGGRIPADELVPIMKGALAGLAHAHAENYVHRDVKPANILLHEVDGRRVAKLGDLGLAKSLVMAGLSGFTMTGQSIGAGHFMAPEQFTNFREVRPTADVWSAGATIFHLLTGEHPRHGTLAGPARPIRRVDRGVPADLAEVVDTALAEKPERRYRDAGEMLSALRAAR